MQPEVTDASLELLLAVQCWFQIDPNRRKQAAERLSIGRDPQTIAIATERLADRGDHTEISATIGITPTPSCSAGGSANSLKRPPCPDPRHHLRSRQHLIRPPLVAVAHIHEFNQAQLHPLITSQIRQGQQLILIHPRWITALS